MGIPHLTRHLASLSESVQLGKSQSPSCKAVGSVIVDGPGLVHHVHSTLLAQGGSQIGPIERQPSCDEVSVAVMTYLVLLQLSGVKISKIYFDGALPLNKRETRLSRLETSRRQLETFCLSQRYGFNLSSVENRPRTFHPSRLLRGYHSPTKRAQLPANPFMVSAVTEDLKSRWTASEIKSTLPDALASIYERRNVDCCLSDVTEIVPGEADVFCAALAAQQPGTAILTSDSDLFLFELGPHSSVILYHTIYAESWNEEDPTQSTIKAMQFCPSEISDRLGIPALSYLAHEMDLSPRSTFSELVRRAKTASASSQKTPAYITFLKEYDLTNFQHDPSKGLPGHVLQNSDTRVSELFAQCFSWNGGDSEFLQDQAHTSPRIYLPFLVEDHSRRCAWTEGARIRRLAYSLINLNSSLQQQEGQKKRYSTINECVRRGRRFCFDDVPLYMTDEEIETESARLLDGLEFIQQQQQQEKTGIHEPPAPLFWRTFALYEIHTEWFANHPPQDYHSGLKAFLSLDNSSGRDTVTIDWDNLHGFAQLQAVLYALRMVSQVIRGLELEDNTGPPIKKLGEMLAGLPPLHVLMRSYQEVRRELAMMDELPSS